MEIVAQNGKPDLSICMQNIWRTRSAPPGTSQDSLLGEPKSPSKDNPGIHLEQPSN